MKPGEIYWVDLATGRRPGIVVSRENLNQGNFVVTVLCTTRRFAIRSKLPNCVPFQAGEFGMSSDCVAQCEAIYALEKGEIDTAVGMIGRLDAARLRDVIKAIGDVIDSDGEPKMEDPVDERGNLAERTLDAMLTPSKWPPLVRRVGEVNVMDLVGVRSLHDHDLPGHRMVLLLVLLLAVKDRATEVHFEPWRFAKDEGERDEDYDELGIRMFYEVEGQLHELVPPPRFFRTYIARDIEAVAALDTPRRRAARLLRQLASQIDGQEPEPRRGYFRLNLDEVPIDVEVLAYASELGERYFLKLSTVPEAASEAACAELSRLFA